MGKVKNSNISDGGQDLSLTTFLISPQQLKAKLGEDVHIPCPTTGTGQFNKYFTRKPRKLNKWFISKQYKISLTKQYTE